MKYIAHRGLFNGPDSKNENNPGQIALAIEQGYDAEIDLWLLDNKLYLGHDMPQYEIDKYWLRHNSLWIHAKNLSALDWLMTADWKYNYFWHENDSYVVTSKGFIWANPTSSLTINTIMVMPEHVDKTLTNAYRANVYGICSDYVEKIKVHRNENNSMR